MSSASPALAALLSAANSNPSPLLATATTVTPSTSTPAAAVVFTHAFLPSSAAQHLHLHPPTAIPINNTTNNTSNNTSTSATTTNNNTTSNNTTTLATSALALTNVAPSSSPSSLSSQQDLLPELGVPSLAEWTPLRYQLPRKARLCARMLGDKSKLS